MRFRRDHGVAVSLLLASHPVPAGLLTVVLTLAAALSGRSATECALVAAATLVGQLTVGWVDDLVDRDRDRESGRQDRPVAMGWVEPGTVLFTIACATLLLVPLAVANGTVAGIALLLAVLSGWAYHLWFKRWWLSWLPWAVGFALLPAFLSYGGLGGGVHGGPPTWEVTVLSALLGVGVHVLQCLPDLVEDRATGLRHLPLLIALRTGAPRLLWIATTYTLLVSAGLVSAALAVGLRQ